MPPEPPAPAWVEAWRDGRRDIIILCAALAALTLILALQQQLARWRAAHRWIRNGFLVFTLVWIGWVASAQLSIINIINYARAPLERFDWTFYLVEPLIVIIAGYTLLSLLILGRGVFCGWLCPFGALQIGRAHV